MSRDVTRRLRIDCNRYAHLLSPCIYISLPPEPIHLPVVFRYFRAKSKHPAIMVRNMPSMRSLANVNDTDRIDHEAQRLDPPADQTPTDDTRDLVVLCASAAPPMQLGGCDSYTKDRMTRMATGQATLEERKEFEERVREMQYTKTRETSPQWFATGPSQAPGLPSYEALEDASKRLARQDRLSHPSMPTPARRGQTVADCMRLYCLQNRQSEQTVDMRSAKKESIELKKATHQNAAAYTKPFCDFLTDNPTVFHCVAAMRKQLLDAGWKELDERDSWSVKPSGKYFVERNGSSLIAFVVGAGYKSGNGAAILAGHVDALTAKLKPVSSVPNKAGYLQLGVAPYAGGLGPTWWDRDLGIGGRVLIKEGGKIVTKLVKLDWPIAKIPTLAPHFGAPASGPFNPETQMVPIIGLEGTSTHAGLHQTADPFSQPSLLGSLAGPVGSFVHTQPPGLVKAISKELGLNTASAGHIVNWELELFDVQPATVGGLEKEFIFAGRIDDKLCSWAALQALIESEPDHTADSSIIKVVGLFDDEEIGSLLRQGARGNFLPSTIERTVSCLAGDYECTSELFGRTYANSFLVSSDVTHAVNPNFLNVYLENHAPHLNVGVVVSADSNGHMTTDSVSTALFQRCADAVDAKLQVFQIRNDSRSGGTVGPMLSAATGVRSIDAGIPQLSMHSIRATTGALDPGLGVIMFAGFLNSFEKVDKEFRA